MSSNTRAFSSRSSWSWRTSSATRPGRGCWPDARKISANASVFEIRPSDTLAPIRAYSTCQVSGEMPASADSSFLRIEKSQVKMVS